MKIVNGLEVEAKVIDNSHRQFRISSKLTPDQITEILGVEPVCDDPDKVEYYWEFGINGEDAAIWDYNGSRWSCYGRLEYFEQLGFEITGS